MAIHGERMRDRLVAHQGKADLVFSCNDWVLESPENPWNEAFESWTDQIREHVGEGLHGKLLCDFSTTTKLERSVSQVVMMDIFKKYFHYTAVCICGIPTVTLKGTPQDWQRLSEKVEALKPFDIDWWLEHLRPICKQFIRASQGDIDLEHWQNICKLKEAYGGNIINGWVAKMFPYLQESYGSSCTLRNPIFETGEGFQTLFAPSGLSQVPFTWVDHAKNETRAMEAIAGVMGVFQDEETGAVEAKAFWAIRESSELEQLINLIGNEHETVLRNQECDDGFPNAKQFPKRNLGLPSDLERFYFEFTSATLVDAKREAKVWIDRISGIQSVGFIDEEDDFTSRGPDGRTGTVLANLPMVGVSHLTWMLTAGISIHQITRTITITFAQFASSAKTKIPSRRAQ